jgi:hypothetical protein
MGALTGTPCLLFGPLPTSDGRATRARAACARLRAGTVLQGSPHKDPRHIGTMPYPPLTGFPMPPADRRGSVSMSPLPSRSGQPGYKPQPEHGAGEEQDRPRRPKVCVGHLLGRSVDRKRHGQRGGHHDGDHHRLGEVCRPPAAGRGHHSERQRQPDDLPGFIRSSFVGFRRWSHPSQTSHAETVSTTATTATFILIASDSRNRG